MRGRLAWAGVLLLLLLSAAAPCEAEPARVLAAFTLKPALDAIADDYRKAGGEVVLVYGPSPALAKQIENGASGDLFFSADPVWVEQLAQRQLIKGPVVDLIGNRLVLVARKGAMTPLAITRALPLDKLAGAG